MSKSSMLRASDVRSLIRIINECRDRGHDWWAWQRCLLDGLAGLTNSDLALGGEVGGVRSPRLRNISPPFIVGRPGFDVDHDRIHRTIEEHNFVPGASRFIDEYLTRWLENDGVVLSNHDLYSDREWRGSVDMQTMGLATGTETSMLCCREIDAASGPTGEVLDVTMMREDGRRAFSGRDRLIIQEAVAAIVPLLGGPLARFGDPSPRDLPPRARQVLACFLEGDGDKQVAARLKISPHTVNQYAKRIFRHFGVRSRTELLARWIARGWTNTEYEGE